MGRLIRKHIIPKRYTGVSTFITYAEETKPGDRVRMQDWYLIRAGKLRSKAGVVLPYRGKRDVLRVQRDGIKRPELWMPDVWELDR